MSDCGCYNGNPNSAFASGTCGDNTTPPVAGFTVSNPDCPVGALPAFTMPTDPCGCGPSTSGNQDLSDFVRKTGPLQNVSSVINFTISPQVPVATQPNQAVNLSQISALISQDGIISGLGLSISGSNVIVAPGSWRISGTVHSTSAPTTLAIDAQDPSMLRYDVVYADGSGNLNVVSGDPSATPVYPDIPDNTLMVGAILITPTTVTTIPVIGSYVTTNTNQSGLSGTKNWVSKHVFHKAPGFLSVPTGTVASLLAIDSSGNLIQGTGYVPYTGAVSNVDLGNHGLQLTGSGAFVALHSDVQNIGVTGITSPNLYSAQTHTSFEVHNSTGGTGGTDMYTSLKLNRLEFNNISASFGQFLVPTAATLAGNITNTMPSVSGILAVDSGLLHTNSTNETKTGSLTAGGFIAPNGNGYVSIGGDASYSLLDGSRLFLAPVAANLSIGYQLYVGGDGTLHFGENSTQKIQFSNYDITRLSDGKKVLWQGDSGTQPPLDIVVIAGQSNALGFMSDLSLQPPIPAGQAMVWNGTAGVGVTTGPIGSGTSGSAWAAYAIARFKRTNRPILFVPTAVGDTAQWVGADGGNGNWDTAGTLTAASIAAAQAAITWATAQGYSTTVAVNWCQGEQDTTFIDAATETIAQYTTAFTTMRASFRTALGITLPFNIYRVGQTTAGALQVQAAQDAAAIAEVYTNVVFRDFKDFTIANGLSNPSTPKHATQAGYNLMGQDGANNEVQRHNNPIYDQFGKFGFGVTAPLATVHVGAGNTTTPGMMFQPSTITSSAVSNAWEYDGVCYYETDQTGLRRCVLSTANYINIATNTYVINANASPTAPIPSANQDFYIQGADGAVVSHVIDAIGSFGGIVMRRSDGTAAARTVLALNDVIGQIGVAGYTGAGFSGTSAAIQFTAAEVFGATNGTNILFKTAGIGGTGAVTHMEMYASGAVQIQTSGSFTEDATSLFTLVSTTRGWLQPRMSTTNRTAISSPTEGLNLYDSTLHGPFWWDGTAWQQYAKLASPTFTTPTLGVASATSINKVTITTPATSAVLTILNGKTLTANNTLTLAGTDSTVMTFPSASTNVVGNPNGALNILASTQTTLVAGTKALAVTGVTTTSKGHVTLVSQGGTVTTTIQYEAVCTSGTVTINAVTTAGTNVLNTLDTSIVNVFVTN